MNLYTLIFIISIVAIEFGLFYSPLYFIGYSWLKLDKKYGDTPLSILLVLVSALLCYLFFSLISNIIFNLMTTINHAIYG